MPTTMYILACMGKVLVLNAFEWTHHARSGSPLDDYQHLTSTITRVVEGRGCQYCMYMYICKLQDMLGTNLTFLCVE